ncbi:hypothetical protein LCGC14_1359680 [marine sediment metagenome]|uniref:Response regulatory domain-containing protein n=1 Tax=marine sediment metagenome TaxID=412755 RepID=A0A0F9KUI5_9ZZZZ
MVEEVVILMAEDDEGHAGLIRRNLQRAGISNEIVHFKDGGETIDSGPSLFSDWNLPGQ